MKALLINPHKLIPSSWSITQRASPPLGLAYIASVLENQNYQVKVYDCIAEAAENYFDIPKYPGVAVQGIPFEKMFAELDEHYDLIGMSIMFSNNWLINRELLNQLKLHFPLALIIAGGEHVSAIPEYCMRDCEGLDAVVVGEGEETMEELAIHLKNKTNFSSTLGLAVKIRDGELKIILNEKRIRIREISGLSMPAWHLFPINKYFEHDISGGITYGNSLPIFATRGCPYECTFCSSPQMWGVKYNMREVENVIAEIKYLYENYKVTNIDFYDLTAIINKRWILDFCATIEREGLKITWQIPAGTRSEAITYEVALALKKSGCKNITYAPESGSPQMLEAIKKKVMLPKMLNSIDQSYKAGLNVKLNILMGYPEEKMIDIFRTYLFLIKASFYGANDASPSMFSPYPGSALFDELLSRKEVELSDRFFEKIIFSNSLHHISNYNRHYSKTSMTFLLFLSYVIFYGSNFLFRPVRAIRMFMNVASKKYETRGEYMLAEILKRKRAINSKAA